MSDPVDTPVESAAPEQPVETAGGEPAGNPAWDEIRSRLDPTTFKLIEPTLKGWETSAQKRIEDSNKQYGWAADLTKRGVTPEQIQQSLLVADKLNEDPAAIHEALGNFLRENGRLPNKQELQEQVEDEADDAETDDPRFSKLEQQQEEMRQFLASQQEQQQIAQASAELDQEVEAVKKAHPDFQAEDIQEVMQRAALKAQVTGSVPPLEDMAAEYIGLRNRILTTPRAADSAPRLLPTGGGVAQATAGTKSLGQLDKTETQALVAQMIQGGAV